MPVRFLFCFLALGASTPSGGAEPAARVQVRESPPVTARLSWNRKSIDVATPLRVDLQIAVPELPFERALETGYRTAVRPEPQLAPWLRLPEFRIRVLRDGEADGKGGMTVYRWTFLLEAQLPGSYTLPPLETRLEPADESAESRSVTFESIPINVASLISGDPATADPRPAVAQLPPASPDWSRWLLLIPVILLWAALRYILWRLRQRRLQEERDTPGDSARAHALRRLEDAATAPQAYEVLRAFLNEEWGADLAGVTAEDAGTLPGLPPEARRHLQSILERLQPAVYSRESSPLEPALREELQQFVRVDEA